MKDNLLICEECISLNEQLLKKCQRCSEKYCMHNSSDLDIDHCFHCMNEVILSVTNLNREVRRVNPSTGKESVSLVKIGTEYRFEGSDWLYISHKIKDFADDPDGDFKFTKMIEFYSALAKLMISYREDVRQAKLDKLRSTGVSAVKLPKKDNSGADKIIVGTPHSPESTAKKKIVAILKIALGREPSQLEIETGLKTLGFSI